MTTYFLRWVGGNPNNFIGRCPQEISLMSLLSEKEQISVGRHPSNDIVLESFKIPLLLSRFHAEIVFSSFEQHFAVVDKRTTNGTYVDNKIIPRGVRTELTKDCILSFGGPAKVVREGSVLENPFRFQFIIIPADSEVLSSEPAAADGGNEILVPEQPEGAQNEIQQSDAVGNPEEHLLATQEDDEANPIASSAKRIRQGSDPREDQKFDVKRPKLLTQQHGNQDLPAADVGSSTDCEGAAKALLEGTDTEGLMRARTMKAAEEMKCAICFDVMVNPHILPKCAHSFCGICIFKWLSKSFTCPCCRKGCGSGPIEQPNLEKMIKILVEPSLADSEIEARNERSKSFLELKKHTQNRIASQRESMRTAATFLQQRRMQPAPQQMRPTRVPPTSMVPELIQPHAAMGGPPPVVHPMAFERATGVNPQSERALNVLRQFQVNSLNEFLARVNSMARAEQWRGDQHARAPPGGQPTQAPGRVPGEGGGGGGPAQEAAAPSPGELPEEQEGGSNFRPGGANFQPATPNAMRQRLQGQEHLWHGLIVGGVHSSRSAFQPTTAHQRRRVSPAQPAPPLSPSTLESALNSDVPMVSLNQSLVDAINHSLVGTHEPTFSRVSEVVDGDPAGIAPQAPPAPTGPAATDSGNPPGAGAESH